MGGFGSAVLEALAEEGVSTPLRALGVPDVLVEHGADLASLGLDAAGVVKATQRLLLQRDAR